MAKNEHKEQGPGPGAPATGTEMTLTGYFAVELTRNCQVGDTQCKRGDIIAGIECFGGVEPNFVVDAVRNGLAHAVNLNDVVDDTVRDELRRAVQSAVIFDEKPRDETP